MVDSALMIPTQVFAPYFKRGSGLGTRIIIHGCRASWVQLGSRPTKVAKAFAVYYRVSI